MILCVILLGMAGAPGSKAGIGVVRLLDIIGVVMVVVAEQVRWW